LLSPEDSLKKRRKLSWLTAEDKKGQAAAGFTSKRQHSFMLGHLTIPFSTEMFCDFTPVFARTVQT